MELDKIKSWFRRTENSAAEVAEGERTVATPAGSPSGPMGDTDRETSTNAQVEGAADEPGIAASVPAARRKSIRSA